ncbi:TetR/AcrR family transcriptional regulator [Loigolactobacillus backii]|uniref:Uncharacterized protein n=1 Tax=Loigolactobacillus backii TaxID=375175 RepID=A0A192GZM9_9LACO|nr:TetR/AcrR family transcriptional regulator [Loigolactobacillus backii]ANK61447.1 hypothetical protein AYR53_00935 [Loigolactobacillus backii]ANK69354.1 hypothetical protein AYR56_03780 [Loigolactobacillus backii]MDA5387788.1 TetR/AcrR family transcriptional regulator [Loigolactobacillus backii]MDA5390882.1 TetR/AcrR family transcriptional regulator [Loigolactobacillus backii]PIO84197.1 TetR family transcriptional regulator [Loigolactobacillus backii]
MAKTDKTEAKILTAFSELLIENDFRDTTTKKIAATAGINESTFFRHFKNKRTLLLRLIDDYSDDINTVSASFVLKGNIEYDLVHGAKLYADFIAGHKGVLLLGLRDARQYPEIAAVIRRLPNEFKRILMSLFTQMIAKGEISEDTDIEVETTNYIMINFGNAVFKYAYDNSGMDVPQDEFVERNIRTFARHLKE